MATLRDIKRKIDAVKKTSQITKAMNMVAAAKLRGAQQNMEKFNPYAGKFREVIQRVAGGVEERASYELLNAREEVKKIELVLVTADRGLCGSFNNGLIVKAERFIQEKLAEGLEVSLTAGGRKGADYFRRRKYAVRSRLTGLLNKPSYDDAFSLGQELIGLFENRDCDEVYVIYSHFVSMVRQQPTLIKLLPVESSQIEEGPEEAVEYLFEPSHEALLTDLLPNYVYIQILEALYQTAVSEHAARMAAMENATNNCKELVKDLTLTYNKARQAGITKELMDIVGGAEALKK
ncbi:ATP synthase F1 subunit gamma [Desulfoferrobacter suflitae]|uniref:ATP synthase F1 subunit gamma n=1 Tax=Desulfoferrobacter suflitae TaxID=2865782 RepID=UPI002164C3B5|nr:ATP synthase F1 subunit gamma [Desulfoferrobacter suflitae]MCK8601137.1 ATP synthase F1 subunit gamma [Desulfoferrobacter suflitae]